MKICSCLLVAFAILISAYLENTYAQSVDCPSVNFELQDRAEVAYTIGVLSEQLMDLEALALMGCQGNFSATQKLALSSEYEARIRSIKHIAEISPKFITPATAQFLTELFHPLSLGIGNTSILEEKKACAAWRANKMALLGVQECYTRNVAANLS